MAQIATQAQAVGLMAAATRPAGILGGQAMDARQARQLAGEAALGMAGAPGRMPAIRQVNDPAQVERMLVVCEGKEG